MIVHTTPSSAKMWKAYRQFTNAMTATTSKGVKAPPQRAPIHMIACARLRSRNGSQALKALVRLGKHPASPAANKNRAMTIETWLHAQPVAAVKNDHHSTTRTSTLRAPILSPSQPVG